MPQNSLDDPGYSAFAWGRYWRVMRMMTLLATAVVPIALVALYWADGALPVHMGIAVALAVFFTIVLGAALMGLVFLSSGSGHDEAVNELFEASER